MSARVVVHYEDGAQVWRAGQRLTSPAGEPYKVTREGLAELVAALVAAGLLTPTDKSGHYDATAPEDVA